GKKKEEVEYPSFPRGVKEREISRGRLVVSSAPLLAPRRVAAADLHLREQSRAEQGILDLGPLLVIKGLSWGAWCTQ
uniref:Uncharacterized protein n=1 Tax=Oryza barthii TaxID=65489 RepID=A0A0D3GBL5_9ORYZ